MRKFIGLIFSMGLISMSSYKKYWSKDLLFKNEHMTHLLCRENILSPSCNFSILVKNRFLDVTG